MRLWATIYLFFILLLPVIVFAAPADYILLEPTLVGQSADNTTVRGLESNGATSFAAYFQLLYQVIMAAGVIAAVGMFVWGGFEYMFSEVPYVKVKGKANIWRALEGLAFLLGAYLILNTINPRLTHIELGLIKVNPEAAVNPNGTPVVPSGFPGGSPPPIIQRANGAPAGDRADHDRFKDNSPGVGVYGYVPANEFTVRADLKAAGISVNDEDVCKQGSVSGCKTYVGGLNSAQIAGLKKMKQECNCEVVVSGAAEQGFHGQQGTTASNHFNGTAVDVRDNPGVNRYKEQNGSVFWATNDERGGKGSHWHFEFK